MNLLSCNACSTIIKSLINPRLLGLETATLNTRTRDQTPVQL